MKRLFISILALVLLCGPAHAQLIPNARLANMSQSTIKGRDAGVGTGSPQDLTVTEVLDVLGVSAFVRTLLDDADAATFRASIGAGTGSGTVTSVTGTAPISSSGGATPAISLDNDGVTFAKIQNAVGNSKLVGSGAAGAGADFAEITLGTNLSMSGTTLNAAGGGGSTPTGTGFRHVTAGVEDGASKLVDTADVNDDQITYAKMQNVSAQSLLLGRGQGAGGGNVEEIELDSTMIMGGAFVGVRQGSLQLGPGSHIADLPDGKVIGRAIGAGLGPPTSLAQGTGGGIDSDLLDGLDSASFVRADASDTVGTGFTTTWSASQDSAFNSIVGSNTNAGTSAYSQALITNDGGVGGALRLMAMGTAWTTQDGFVQDGAVVGSGTGLTGGLSLMTEEATAPMRFYTGGYNNERMRITASGAVGIGTAAPDIASAQHVAGTAVLTVKGTTAYGVVEFGTGQSDADGRFVGNLEWSDVNSTSTDKRRAAIAGQLQGTTANKRGCKLSFYTTPDNSDTITERLTIDKDGLVTFVNSAPVFAAGSATANSKPKLTAGTLLTTPEAGALELDATNVYATTDAGNRGYVPVVHFIRANATRTFVSNNTAQVIFTSPANGRLTLETGVYRFEGFLYFTAMSATSGNRNINLLGAGTATIGDWLWDAHGIDGAAGTAAAKSGSAMITSTSPASIVTAGVGTALSVYVAGTFEVTGAGTIIPTTTMVTAAASVLAIGSYLRFERMGAANVVSVGQWD